MFGKLKSSLVRTACSAGRWIRNKAAAIVGAGSLALAGAKASAQAFTTNSTDPTTILTGVAADYTYAIGIAIGAIAVGAVIMYIRKGLKARA